MGPSNRNPDFGRSRLFDYDADAAIADEPAACRLLDRDLNPLPHRPECNLVIALDQAPAIFQGVRSIPALEPGNLRIAAIGDELREVSDREASKQKTSR